MKKKLIVVSIAIIILLISLIFIIDCFDKTGDNGKISSDPDLQSSTEINSNTESENLIFEGKIVDIRTDEIEITVTDGKSTGFTKGEPLILMTENLETGIYSSLKVNDYISVEFNGIVMNSFPGRIGSISEIKLIDDF